MDANQNRMKNDFISKTAKQIEKEKRRIRRLESDLMSMKEEAEMVVDVTQASIIEILESTQNEAPEQPHCTCIEYGDDILSYTIEESQLTFDHDATQVHDGEIFMLLSGENMTSHQSGSTTSPNDSRRDRRSGLRSTKVIHACKTACNFCKARGTHYQNHQ